MHHLFFLLRFYLFVYEWGLVTGLCTGLCHGQVRGLLYMVGSRSVLWTLEPDLKLSGLQGKCFYPLSLLRSPVKKPG